jgi:hypothetical protein
MGTTRRDADAPEQSGGEAAWRTGGMTSAAAAKLEALVAEVETHLASSPATLSEYAEWRAAIAQDRAFLVEITCREGGRYWGEPSTARLRLAKITVSCTAGERGLMHNWLSRAKKVLAEAGRS